MHARWDFDASSAQASKLKRISALFCHNSSRILSIFNSDWLQHACSLRGVYEWSFIEDEVVRSALFFLVEPKYFFSIVICGRKYKYVNAC